MRAALGALLALALPAAPAQAAPTHATPVHATPALAAPVQAAPDHAAAALVTPVVHAARPSPARDPAADPRLPRALPPLAAGATADDLLFADRLPVNQEPHAATAELVTVVLPPGEGGTGTDFPETFHYALPAGYEPGGAGHPLLVALHGFGASAASVANQSTLDEECAARGWIFLAPTGLDDKLFGSPPCQQHIEAAIGWALQNLDVDEDRIAMVGFSVGAGVAANFVARHRDPDGLMIACLGLVSPSLDWAGSHAQGNATIKALLEGPLNFGAPPSVAPFAYHASSALVFEPGTLAPGPLVRERSMAGNLGATFVYLTWDKLDSLLLPTVHAPALAELLDELGGEHVVRKVSGTTDPLTGAPATHSWAVLDEAHLLDHLDGRRVQRTPQRVRLLAAEDGRASFLHVQRAAPDDFGRLTAAFVRDEAEAATAATPSPARLHVRGLDGLLSVEADLAAAGYDGGAPLRVSLAREGSPAGAPPEVVLSGWPRPPGYLARPDGTLLPGVDVDPWAATVGVPLPGRALEAIAVFVPEWTARLASVPDPVPPGGEVVLHLDGPTGATLAALLLSPREVLGTGPGGIPLGVGLGPPGVILLLALDAQGDGALALPVRDDPALAGLRLAAQALVLDGPAVASNLWAIHVAHD